MASRKRIIGFLAGIVVFLIIFFIDIPGLEYGGQTLLALLLMTIVFWATQVVQPGFSAALFLMLLIIFQVIPSYVTAAGKTVSAFTATAETVFSPWLGSTLWLVIGAYIIAHAVTSSGLGERIAYLFINKFVSSFKTIIFTIFLLNVVMSLIIPHPFPKAFIIFAVMKVVMDSSKMCQEDRIKVGFTVFAAAIPTSMIFLTGDGSFAPLVSQFAGVEVSWIGWLGIMGVPAVVMTLLTMLLILVLFRPKEQVVINKEEIRIKQQGLGKLKTTEIRTIIWLVIAIVLWMTSGVHGIDVGWITLLVAACMSLPIIGEVITPKAWADVPVPTLIFLTAALAISKAGGATGMTAWLSDLVVGVVGTPGSVLLLAVIVGVIAIVCHMVLGSCIAVMGLVCPIMVPFAAQMMGGQGISPLIPAFITYTAIYAHYIFPHHNLPILVGSGEGTAGYGPKETIRMGLPLTVVVLVVICVVEVGWFKIIGLY